MAIWRYTSCHKEHKVVDCLEKEVLEDVAWVASCDWP